MATQSRKRIALACNGCRAKRTKCDGNHPQCSACRYREEECQFTDAESKRKRPSNAYIRALEARVASLEQQLDLSPTLGSIQEKHGHGRPPSPPVVEPVLADPADPAQPSDTTDTDSAVDDLAEALGCFALGDYGELCFFGASSNFSIIQNHAPRIASSTAARQRGLAAARALPGGMVDLSDELRDHLLDLFWRWQNAWQYVVPKELFLRDLHAAGTGAGAGGGAGRYCTPLLLTAVCALASRYSPRPELRTDPHDPNTAGLPFIAQAQAMLHCEYAAPTTPTVQAAALLALFWVSIDQESVGYLYLGMASRMAMNTALHIDCTPYVARRLLTADDAEARAVAFWGLYALDNLFSLGMGRPLSILQANITARRPQVRQEPMNLGAGAGHVFGSGPGVGAGAGAGAGPNTDAPTWPTAYIVDNAMHLCDLFQLSSEIIDRLYTQRPTWAGKERDARILAAHLRLTRFLDQLPRHLKLAEGGGSRQPPSPPFVYMMHLQYHLTMILLHRPLFVVAQRRRRRPAGDDLHAQACLQSAARMSTILRVYRSHYTCRHMPISTVHCALTAAIIHLLDLRSAAPASMAAHAAAAARRLHVCLLVLYELNENWDWANRSIRALRSLAAQWHVDIDIGATGLAAAIAPMHRLQYERYEQRCPPAGPQTIAVKVGAAAPETARDLAPNPAPELVLESSPPPPPPPPSVPPADGPDWLAEDPFAFFWPYDEDAMLSFNFDE